MEQLKEEIKKCLEVLNSGGLILYPTDTVWGIGCDATNMVAVNKIFKLKQRPDSKTMICLVANDAMLERHVKKVPDMAYDIMDLSEKPVTIVYDNPVGVAANLIAEQEFKKPLVSTSANLAGNPTPRTFVEIESQILKGVDYVVNLQREGVNAKPSSIIRLKNDGTVKVIRE